MSAHPDRIAWLDTETTGLDETNGHLLEIAIIITDNELNEIAEPFSQIVRPATVQWKSVMNDFVTDMHTVNGLIAAIDDGEGAPRLQVELDAVNYIHCHCGTEFKPMLAGNSITFDRVWTAHHTPALLAALHYRSIDVTSLDQFVTRSTSLESLNPDDTMPSDHRAVSDLRRSIAVAKHIRQGINRALASQAG